MKIHLPLRNHPARCCWRHVLPLRMQDMESVVSWRSSWCVTNCVEFPHTHTHTHDVTQLQPILHYGIFSPHIPLPQNKMEMPSLSHLFVAFKLFIHFFFSSNLSIIYFSRVSVYPSSIRLPHHPYSPHRRIARPDILHWVAESFRFSFPFFFYKLSDFSKTKQHRFRYKCRKLKSCLFKG